MSSFRYSGLLAFSNLLGMSGWRRKSGAKYSRYSVLLGRSGGSSVAANSAVSCVQHRATFLQIDYFENKMHSTPN